MRRLKVIPACLILCFLLPLTCTRRGDTLAKIIQERKVVIGIANEIPYGYKDTDGAVKGEAPDIARFVCGKMGVEEIRTVVTEFGSLIPGLKAGRFDIIAAGMYITPKRCRQILFSRPTYSIGESFLVKKGNPLRLHSYDDVIKNTRVRLGVMAGAVEYGYARDTGVPQKRIVVFPDNFSGLAGVQSGRIDAFAGTSLTIAKLSRKGHGVEMVMKFRDPVINNKKVRGYGAFGFRKNDKKLQKRFNEILNSFLGTARHIKMVKKYGFTRANLPGSVTTEELCGR